LIEQFKKLCGLSELRENEGRRFIINDTEVAVFKIGQEIFALNNICPHQHTALLYDGFIEDGCVVCPAHGWMFNLKTGKQPTGSSGVESYQTKIENDEVFIFVQDKKLNW
jgi:nitrite reductase/ring-hydroxylating ferredoxin subunit